MNFIEMIIRYCPGHIGVKMRRQYFRYKGAIIGNQCRIFFGGFLFNHTKSTLVDVQIGNDVTIGINSRIYMAVNGSLLIKDNIKISSDVEFHILSGHVIIGEFTLIGRGTNIIPKTRNIKDLNLNNKYREMEYGSIEIGNNVFIGVGCTILNNVRIGNNSVIGAGAVVTRDVPPNSIYAGIPAKCIQNKNE